MKYCDGSEMEKEMWGWHQPDHISGGTPYYMQFVRTVNNEPGDPAGLFRFNEKDNMLHLYWSGSFSKTRNEAITQRIKILEKRIEELNDYRRDS